MRKVIKSRQGFTLLEMVIVIAIIMIISVVVYYSVKEYMDAAKAATEKMSEHADAVNEVTQEISDALT